MTVAATPFAQQMQPPAISATMADPSAPDDLAMAPSMPTSPISLTSTAQLPSLWLARRLTMALDLPAPSGPVMMLQGVRRGAAGAGKCDITGPSLASPVAMA